MSLLATTIIDANGTLYFASIASYSLWIMRDRYARSPLSMRMPSAL